VDPLLRFAPARLKAQLVDSVLAVPDHVHLSRAGVSLVLSGLHTVPRVSYWGPDLGNVSERHLVAMDVAHRPGVPHSALDVPRQAGLVPEGASGFTGMPALAGYRPAGGDVPWSPRLVDWFVDEQLGDSVRDGAVGGGQAAEIQLRGVDAEAGWAVGCAVGLTVEGLVRLRYQVTNLRSDPLVLQTVNMVVPVPGSASELLDLTGRWCRENTPQRHQFVSGLHGRASRRGRTGHDSTVVMIAGEPGFNFDRGRVWGIHLAWSGDQHMYAERTPEGECLLGGGELLGPGEIVLAEGQEYVSPQLLASTGDGLDEFSWRLHDFVRRNAPRSEATRPVVVNTWEAAYFDHRLERLTDLADQAADLGVERFVLDDGWMEGRRSDRVGLGDWTVDRTVYPEGLHPLISHVESRGMSFGLWVEPEMLTIDSATAQTHPDWVLRGRSQLPPEWRHQHVLDLQVPGACDHVFTQISDLLGEYPISFLKWDHNRDLIDGAHGGRPAVHGQTMAFYELLQRLRQAHPQVEIESCASGGGRIDAEVLRYADRVWASDTLDALERHRIQRWLTLLVPPEVVGSHVGPSVAHTTGREHSLTLRAAAAVLYHFGLEWNVTTLTKQEREELSEWIDLHKRIRRTRGARSRLVRVEHPDPAIHITGVVAADQSEAFFVISCLDSTTTQRLAPIRLRGLRDEVEYRVSNVTPASGDVQRGHLVFDRGTAWLPESLVTTGCQLARWGIGAPLMHPESARVLHVERDDSAGA
jgi:alpha-galactosidase